MASISKAHAVRAVPGKCMFKPSLYFKQVQEWHACDSKLEFKLDLSATPFELTDARLAKLKSAALAIVAETEGRGQADAKEVGRRLSAAAAWGDEVLVRTVLETCWVTAALALPALAEAAKSGHEPVVAALIAAGADGTHPVSDAARGKSALHFACAAGQERVARMLIEAAPETARDAVFARVLEGKTHQGKGGGQGEEGEGLSCFDLMRQCDMGMAARRLEAIARQKFGDE